MSIDQRQKLVPTIAKLTSVCDGDLAITEVIACGEAAVPELRRLLFEREPSGLFEARCRVVEALAGLRAYGILIAFLESRQVADDPIESLGDDAVINAAAQVVSKQCNERTFQLLLRLAQRPCLTGVISALGSFQRTESIPALVEALEDDASWQVAARALRQMGSAAQIALVGAAKRQSPSSDSESESSFRRRMRATQLLNELSGK